MGVFMVNGNSNHSFKENLQSYLDAKKLMESMMGDKLSNSEIAEILKNKNINNITIDEMIAFAEVMKQRSHQIKPRTCGRLVDTCGTGGSKYNHFNISTICSFIVSSAGVPVAKHGNRGVTRKFGSADLLEALGANIRINPGSVCKLIENINFGFMFTPIFHPAMKQINEVRQELSCRTIFNILGPLTNPANAKGQIIGVFSQELVNKVILAIKNLGVEKAIVVHGIGGLDEISTIGDSYIGELCEGGSIRYYWFSPEDIGINRTSPNNLMGGTIQENIKLTHKILKGEDKSAKTDIILANAAAGIYIGGMCQSLEEGVEIARNIIESGIAFKKLVHFINATNEIEDEDYVF